MSIKIPAAHLALKGHAPTYSPRDALTFLEIEFRGTPHWSLASPSTCLHCGEHLSFQWKGEEEFPTLKNEACAFPPLFTTVTRLEVPSGELLVTDNLYPTVDASKPWISIEGLQGQALLTRRYEGLGVAYNSISNTSPTFFQVGEGEYVIADTWNFQADEEDEQEKLPEGWQALAPINTDLWAYSLMDYQEYLKQGGSPVSENDHGKRVVPMPPGVYSGTHYHCLRGWKVESLAPRVGGREIYGTLNLVKD